MNKTLKFTTVASAIALALASGAAQASHFRGGAMIPTVSAGGLLTVNATTFWRPSSVRDIDEGGAVRVNGGSLANAAMAQQGLQVNNTADARFTVVTSTHTRQLPGAGTYTMTASSCCRVSGVRNVGASGWALTSTIFWDGSSSATPILFSFTAVQPEVVRGQNYVGNLGATSLDGHTLSYDQVLNNPIASQPPGFTINPNTGALSIPGASTATYLDNNGGNPGADYAFSGNIFATDNGRQMGQVEFEWLFDAVNTGSTNLAPQVTDAIVNALVGSSINHIFAVVDDGNPISPGAPSFLPGLTFNPGCGGAASFNNTTAQFSWNSTGCGVGTYIAQVVATDGSLTDTGLLTINLSNPTNGGGGTPVAEPGTLALLGLGLGLGAYLRRRRA